MQHRRICITLIITSLVLLSIIIALPCYSSDTSNYNPPRPDSLRLLESGLISTPLLFPEQSPSVSVSLTTNKPAYLTGENIQVTCTFSGTGDVSWVSDSFKISIKATVDNGNTEEIVPAEQLRGRRTYNWKAPSSPGTISFTCHGQAIYQTSTTTYQTVCLPKGGCITIPITVTQDNQLEDNADVTTQIYNPIAPLSGAVIDQAGKPISGAIVNTSIGGQKVNTDSKGNFIINNYRVGTGYVIKNGIPTADETVSVQAVACETVQKLIEVPATSGISNANFSLTRCFYPAGVDLSQFTLDTFSGWSESANSSTWQNIIGISVDKQLQLKGDSIEFRSTTKNLSSEMLTLKPFQIGQKKLFLLTQPGAGRYFMDFTGEQPGAYQIDFSCTRGAVQLPDASTTRNFNAGSSQRIAFDIRENPNSIEIVKDVNVTLIAVIAGLLVLAAVAVVFLRQHENRLLLQKVFAGIIPGSTKTKSASPNTQSTKKTSSRTTVRTAAKSPAGDKSATSGTVVRTRAKSPGSQTTVKSSSRKRAVKKKGETVIKAGPEIQSTQNEASEQPVADEELNKL